MGGVHPLSGQNGPKKADAIFHVGVGAGAGGGGR